MSKRSLDYNLSLPTSKKSKTKHEEHESDEEEMVENPMMDLFSMNSCSPYSPTRLTTQDLNNVYLIGSNQNLMLFL